MFKKLFALFMLLSIAVVFTGCGSNSNSADGLIKTVTVQVPVSFGKDVVTSSRSAVETVIPKLTIECPGIVTEHDGDKVVVFENFIYDDAGKNYIFSKVIHKKSIEADVLAGKGLILIFNSSSAYIVNSRSVVIDSIAIVKNKNTEGYSVIFNGDAKNAQSITENSDCITTAERVSENATSVKIGFKSFSSGSQYIAGVEINDWAILITDKETGTQKLFTKEENEKNAYLTLTSDEEKRIHTIEMTKEGIEATTRGGKKYNYSNTDVKIVSLNYTNGSFSGIYSER